MKYCANRSYAYIRVSTAMQVKDGLSLDGQTSRIKEWCQINNHTLVNVYGDKGISGRSIDKRAKLKELLDIIRKGDTIITYSISRFSRSTVDYLNMVKFIKGKGCRLIVLKQNIDTDDPRGNFSATIHSAFAELEAEVISERVREGMRNKKDKGEFVGRPPYGWRLSNGKGSNLEEIPEQQEIIRKIKELRDTKRGGYTTSYQKITDYLNDNKIKLPGKSKKWYHSTVRDIYLRKEVITKGRR